MPEPLPPRLRGAAAAALGALVFLALVVPAYARFSTVLVTADRDLPRELTGFYPIERAGGLSFAWTRPHAGLALPAIDRRVPWRLAIRAQVWRPAGVPLPRVRLAADGIALVDRVMDGGESEVGATIPPRPGRRGVLVTIDTAPFVPGGEDTRALGLAVESVRLQAASGWPRLPFSALAPAALAVLLIGLLFAAIGLPAGWAFAGACTAALAECWGSRRASPRSARTRCASQPSPAPSGRVRGRSPRQSPRSGGGRSALSRSASPASPRSRAI